MNIIRRYFYSIFPRKLSGKWRLCLFFFPSVLFSQFHVIGDTKITLNSDVIVSKPDSSLVHTVIEQKETSKIYVVEGTKIYGFEQTISNEISYIKPEPKPKAGHENRQVLAKKENPVKKSSKNPKEVTDKKPDSFKIVPVSIPSGSFSSVVKMQNAVLPLVLKRQKTDATEALFSGISRVSDRDDSSISVFSSFIDLIESGYRTNFTTRPPPSYNL